MATQQEVLSHITTNYQCETVNNNDISLKFGFTDGRFHRVVVRVTEKEIIYMAPFASINEVTPKEALEANYKYALGMKLVGDNYVVHHIANLEDWDASEIAKGFEWVALVADSLEEELLGRDNL